MSKLWWAISFQILGGVFAWIQLQGHYAWPSVKLMKNPAGGYKPHKGASQKATFEIQKVHSGKIK